MRITLDTDKIQEILGISEEEVMRRMVKNAIKLQDECNRILHKREVEVRLQDPEYTIFVRKFFNEYELLRKWFADKTIVETCAKYMGIRDLAKEFVDRDNHGKNATGWLSSMIWKCDEVRTLKKLHGPGSRSGATERVMCSIYWKENHYQGINGGHDVVKALIYRKYPKLKKMELAVYDINRPDDYVFLKTSNGSLYIPFNALMNGDIETIKEYHTEYHTRYYRKNEENLKKAMSILDTDEAKNFFEIIRKK